MKTIKVSEHNHSRLVSITAYMTLQTKIPKTMDDAITHLLKIADKTQAFIDTPLQG